MRYVQARAKEQKRDRAYRIYVTDGLYFLAGLNMRYTEMISDNTTINETREPEEIISGIRAHLNEIARR